MLALRFRCGFGSGPSGSEREGGGKAKRWRQVLLAVHVLIQKVGPSLGVFPVLKHSSGFKHDYFASYARPFRVAHYRLS